jgi:GT2 family glycosyltransferase
MISVVTITFNNPDELVATLGSLEGAPGVESVVVNGGRPIPEPNTLKRPPGPIIQEKDEGISDAFNKGIRASTGVAVAFLNSGDLLLDSGYYAAAEKRLVDDPSIDFVHADMEFIDQWVGAYRMKPRLNLQALGAGMPFLHPTMVVRKTVFDRIGGFSTDYKIAMDYDFVLRFMKSGANGAYIDRLVVRMDGRGVSSTREPAAFKECERSLRSNDLYSFRNRLALEQRRLRFHLREAIRKAGALDLLRKIKLALNR